MASGDYVVALYQTPLLDTKHVLIHNDIAIGMSEIAALLGCKHIGHLEQMGVIEYSRLSTKSQVLAFWNGTAQETNVMFHVSLGNQWHGGWHCPTLIMAEKAVFSKVMVKGPVLLVRVEQGSVENSYCSDLLEPSVTETLKEQANENTEDLLAKGKGRAAKSLFRMLLNNGLDSEENGGGNRFLSYTLPLDLAFQHLKTKLDEQQQKNEFVKKVIHDSPPSELQQEYDKVSKECSQLLGQQGPVKAEIERVKSQLIAALALPPGIDPMFLDTAKLNDRAKQGKSAKELKALRATVLSLQNKLKERKRELSSLEWKFEEPKKRWDQLADKAKEETTQLEQQAVRQYREKVFAEAGQYLRECEAKYGILDPLDDDVI